MRSKIVRARRSRWCTPGSFSFRLISWYMDTQARRADDKSPLSSRERMPRMRRRCRFRSATMFTHVFNAMPVHRCMNCPAARLIAWRNCLASVTQSKNASNPISMHLLSRRIFRASTILRFLDFRALTMHVDDPCGESGFKTSVERGGKASERGDEAIERQHHARANAPWGFKH